MNNQFKREYLSLINTNNILQYMQYQKLFNAANDYKSIYNYIHNILEVKYFKFIQSQHRGQLYSNNHDVLFLILNDVITFRDQSHSIQNTIGTFCIIYYTKSQHISYTIWFNDSLRDLTYITTLSLQSTNNQNILQQEINIDNITDSLQFQKYNPYLTNKDVMISKINHACVNNYIINIQDVSYDFDQQLVLYTYSEQHSPNQDIKHYNVVPLFKFNGVSLSNEQDQEYLLLLVQYYVSSTSLNPIKYSIISYKDFKGNQKFKKIKKLSLPMIKLNDEQVRNKYYEKYR